MSKVYGTIHTPLMATIRANVRNPERRVAWIKDQLCFLEDYSYIPEPGETVEVMITRALYQKFPRHHPTLAGRLNFDVLQALVVMVIDPQFHMLVAIDGFMIGDPKISGLQTAYGYPTDGTTIYTDDTIEPDAQRLWLTPGRTDVICGNNAYDQLTNPGETVQTPTNVWVDRRRIIDSSASVRTEGLSRHEDGIWSHLVKLDKSNYKRPEPQPIVEQINTVDDSNIPDNHPEDVPDYQPGDVILHTPLSNHSSRNDKKQTDSSKKQKKTGSLGDLLIEALEDKK